MENTYETFIRSLIEENKDKAEITFQKTKDKGKNVYLIEVNNQVGRGFLLSPEFVGDLVPGTDEWDELYEMATNWVLNEIEKSKLK